MKHTIRFATLITLGPFFVGLACSDDSPSRPPSHADAGDAAEGSAGAGGAGQRDGGTGAADSSAGGSSPDAGDAAPPSSSKLPRPGLPRPPLDGLPAELRPPR